MSSSHRVTIRYCDGTARTMQVAAGQTVLDAADANAVPIVSECQSGVCGTCVGRCTEGSYSLARAMGLSQQEKEQGRVLTCQTLVRSDCVIEVDYPFDSNAARLVVGDAHVVRVEHLGSAALLTLDVSELPERLDFKAGQFAQLKVPGGDHWRSYSFAHAPRAATQVEFLIRLLPQGAMSDYLRERACPGDRLQIRGSKGSFHLRAASRRVLLIAGGTGLSAVLAIAEQLVLERSSRPVELIYGVTTEADLVLTSRLAELASRNPGFSWRCIVQKPSAQWRGAVGVVTDLLADAQLDGGNVDIYACGPSPMIDATRQWLRSHGLGNANLYYEKFVASGASASQRSTRRVAEPLDVSGLRRDGRGTAVVIGGSIAGMATAQVLTNTFTRVLVLEKDQDHRRTEGRPGAAQGWHLHHLLIAGQRQLESIFPGIIDDMVAAGAFRVDMGEQYRIMLAGSWKKVGATGVDIVCAGRPLLEWCVRRRLDSQPAIDYRYESEVVDLVFDPDTRSVIGVIVERYGERTALPAEFVVDASGKNTPVPGLLERAGLGTPVVEEDCLNCFYSTMQHRVPPQRAWRDKVMVICYAQRPQQQYYAAQYFTDSTRTILSTSLVGYNCYRPPRNAEEFREFARLMPSRVIGNELDGLEPCSPVYNFRYPEMRRFRYESMRTLPAGLVAVGDAYCSADPVSGAGMTKSLLELAELRKLLRSGEPHDERLVRSYYRSASRIANRIWLVIREQNLRFAWIKDGARKRPFYFRAHNWYVDRVFELLHEDPRIYRLYLLVTHFVEPPGALLRPGIVARVLARWLRARLTFKKTLLERNFRAGRAGDWDAPLP
jgi:NAD(P)H-flavin reductase/ferredoxin/2-polyprenyl-6-methoxyphenol hydroxylase-like FAD-dependent oxidoreductase